MKYQKLKDELKNIALYLKVTKPQCRSQLSYIDKNNIDYWNTVVDNKIVLKHYWDTISKVYKMQCEFRNKHIAYCLLKGREYDQIEKPAKDNPPNWEVIEGVIREYRNS